MTIGENTKVLDLGIGTGLLTYEIYNKCGEVIGIDFSEKMIEEAYKKMSNGTFYVYDFKDPKDEMEEILKNVFGQWTVLQKRSNKYQFNIHCSDLEVTLKSDCLTFIARKNTEELD